MFPAAPSSEVVGRSTLSGRWTDDLRENMGNVAVKAAKAVDYVNAGTIEFLLDKERISISWK